MTIRAREVVTAMGALERSLASITLRDYSGEMGGHQLPAHGSIPVRLRHIRWKRHASAVNGRSRSSTCSEPGGLRRRRQGAIGRSRYSQRSATIGSTAAARRAGRYAASSVAIVSTRQAPTSAAGSVGVTPKRNVRSE